jgi:hypothetical protein
MRVLFHAQVHLQLLKKLIDLRGRWSEYQRKPVPLVRCPVHAAEPVPIPLCTRFHVFPWRICFFVLCNHGCLHLHAPALECDFTLDVILVQLTGAAPARTACYITGVTALSHKVPL